MFASFMKLWSRNMIVTSDFKPEVEIQPFCACTMKNMQYNPYLWPSHLNFCVVKEIGVEEHNGDIRFKSRNWNVAILCTHSASDHNYRNSLVIVFSTLEVFSRNALYKFTFYITLHYIVDLTVVQMPHSTEHISSVIIIMIIIICHCNYYLHTICAEWRRDWHL